MKTIQVSKFKTAELNPEFNFVRSIEIENNPFDKGAFGEVYFSNSINGAAITTKQVLKILIDDGSGSAKRGYETITKLQEKIINHNKILKQNNEKPIEQINALGALPQFSYEGMLNGKKVLGYSANLLSKNDWLLFGQIFNEDDLNKRKQLRNNFYNLPVDHRLKMAHDLVEGFFHLEQMKFIYADLNPKNFFVNEKKGQLCLIDYEGGAINDNPETYGKLGEWLAPEIQEQLLNSSSSLIKVNTNTDTWAVAIGVHFMLFNFHPLFFMKVRGKKEMQEYFKKYKWPDIDKSNSNFRNEVEPAYNRYIDKLNTEISPSLKVAISDTINNGYTNPNKRLSYKQWTRALSNLMQPPNIKDFSADRKVIIGGAPITLTWQIERAHTITIDNGIGNVTGKNEIKVTPGKNTTYNLKAVGHFGEDAKAIDITIFPTPVIETLVRPTPSFSSNVKIENFVLSRPVVDVRIKFHSTISFNTPQFKEVNAPSFNTQLPVFPKPNNGGNIFKRFMNKFKIKHDEKN